MIIYPPTVVCHRNVTTDSNHLFTRKYSSNRKIYLSMISIETFVLFSSPPLSDSYQTMLFYILVVFVSIHSIYSLDNGLGKTPQMGLFNERIINYYLFLIRME